MVRSPVGASPLRPGRTSARTRPGLYGAPAFRAPHFNRSCLAALGRLELDEANFYIHPVRS